MADLLRAVPVANEAVREVHRGETRILTVPVQRRWWMGPPLSWLPGVHFRGEKKIALDARGSEVWDQIDGRRSVESIVEAFAANHDLKFHDARVLVMQFLQMLLRRNLIAVVGREEQGRQKGG